MKFKHIIQHLKNLDSLQAQLPNGAEDWHSYSDAAGFLRESQAEDVPLHISTFRESDWVIMHSAIVPLKKLKGDYIADLLKWNEDLTDCGYGYGYGPSPDFDGIRPLLFEPLDHTDSKILDGSLPPLFKRERADGLGISYFEMNQRLSHVLELHWIEAKQSWCKLDNMGDVVTVGKVHQDEDLACVTLSRDALDLYLFVSNSCLVRVFEFNRQKGFDERDNPGRQESIQESSDSESSARYIVHRDTAGTPYSSYLRGVQIIRCGQSPEYMKLKLQGREPREYATFIVHDWKHNRVAEVSSERSQIGNYFVESNLPFGISPAFFKTEVLLHYRQDPARYILEDRVIYARNAWSLRYDVNHEEGQVSVYLKDLSSLPYAEQLRWKAFNEAPKGGISRRAYENDFEGNWYSGDDPLLDLKRTLQDFPQQDNAGQKYSIWRMPKLSKSRDIKFLGYVVTDARKEWEDQILALTQILVEGLNARAINSLAQQLGCRDKEMGSIKQLLRILEAKGVTSSEIEAIGKPLTKLQGLRSKGVAHAGSEASIGDQREHFRKLLTECNFAMQTLSGLVRAGIFVSSV